jgi:hypothetical protein
MTEQYLDLTNEQYKDKEVLEILSPRPTSVHFYHNTGRDLTDALKLILMFLLAGLLTKFLFFM